MVYKSQCLDVFSNVEAYRSGEYRRHDTLRIEHPHLSLEYILDEVEVVVASHDDVSRICRKIDKCKAM